MDRVVYVFEFVYNFSCICILVLCNKNMFELNLECFFYNRLFLVKNIFGNVGVILG